LLPVSFRKKRLPKAKNAAVRFTKRIVIEIKIGGRYRCTRRKRYGTRKRNLSARKKRSDKVTTAAAKMAFAIIVALVVVPA
jgi:hypothetical protein